jgi:signal transduction histidine kinase
MATSATVEKTNSPPSSPRSIISIRPSRSKRKALEDGAMKIDSDTLPLLQSELTRLTTITGRIMDFESLTHDIFESVTVERFSLRKITENIADEYIPQFQKKSQNIVLDLPIDTMTSMDRNMYIQILHNIFSNFIKYA